MPIDRGEARALVDSATGIAAAVVSPNGQRLAFAEFANLWAIPVEGDAPARRLSRFEATNQSIANFAWSSDGTRLAILRTTSAVDAVHFELHHPS